MISEYFVNQNVIELPQPHKQLSFAQPIQPQQAGYVYVWACQPKLQRRLVSNETQGSKVWFDDVKVTHTYSRVTQASDYYAFGSVMREQKSPDDLVYRYGYQGEYSEKDLETGWNHFELREFDAVVGRWTAVDPEGQFHSPYIGMGNNPINGTDPDGGYFFGLFGSTSAQRQAARRDVALYGDRAIIENYHSKNISVTYIGELSRVGDFTSTGLHSTTYYNKDGSFKSYETYERLLYNMEATGQVDFDPMTQFTLGLVAVNGVVTVGSKFLSVGSQPGRALFFTGVTSQTAGQFAAETGLTTLNMTAAGSFLNATQGAVLPIFRNSLWRSLSARFAQSASGDVFILQGNAVRLNRIFWQIERPILMNNSKMSGYHLIVR